MNAGEKSVQPSSPVDICEHEKNLIFLANKANSKTHKMTFEWLDPDPGG